MAKHSITEAARLVGVSRQTMTQHLKIKDISVDRDERNRPLIDTSELIRVYGALQSVDVKSDVRGLQDLTQDPDRKTNPLQTEIDTLRRENLESLRARLDAIERERDEWRDQAQRLSRLLVDHGPAQKTGPTSEPETLAVAPQAPLKGGFLTRLFSRRS